MSVAASPSPPAPGDSLAATPLPPIPAPTAAPQPTIGAGPAVQHPPPGLVVAADQRSCTLALGGNRRATLAVPGLAAAFPAGVALTIEDGNSRPYTRAVWKWSETGAQKHLERDARLNHDDLDALFAACRFWTPIAAAAMEREKAAAEAPAAGDDRPPPVLVTIRHEKTPRSQGLVDEFADSGAFVQALAEVPPAEVGTHDLVLEWEGARTLCTVDLDFHGGKKPPVRDLEKLARDLEPAPRAWHLTQGGGLHAYYWAFDGFTAEELGAGAQALLSCAPVTRAYGGTVELLTRTRHPGVPQKGGRCGPLHPGTPTSNFGILARFGRSGVAEKDVAAFMEENGFTLGERLPHDNCVIDPGHASQSPNPVVVGEHGLFCHSCHGRTGNGFASWRRVMRFHHQAPDAIADEEAQPLLDAVDHFCDFAHVNYLFQALAPEIPEACRRALYSAMLKRRHAGQKAKIARCFSEFSFVYGAGHWLYADSLMPVRAAVHDRSVATLASVLEEDAEGELKPVQQRVDRLTHGGNAPGWPQLIGYSFAPIAFQHLERPIGRDGLIRCTPMAAPRRRRVRYLKPNDRIPLAEAEKRIMAYFPGVSINYMRAVLIAAGCAERGGQGRVPILSVHGDTGSAKSTTPLIVTAMLGESPLSLSQMEAKDMPEAFGEGMRRSRLVIFDDYAKNPETVDALWAFLLRLNGEEMSYRKLYVGGVSVPVTSAVILTDRVEHERFIADAQFGRRAHIIRLPGEVPDWAAMGHKSEGWWESSEDLQVAAESWFSHMVDDFFPPGDREDFDLKMGRLGVNRVRDDQSPDVEELKAFRLAQIKLIARAVGEMEPRQEQGLEIFGNAHEVNFGMMGGPALSQACTRLAESYSSMGPVEERLDHAFADYKGALNKAFAFRTPVELKVRAFSGKVLVRLQEAGKSNKRERLFNRALFSSWPPVERPDAPAAPPVQAASVAHPKPVAVQAAAAATGMSDAELKAWSAKFAGWGRR